MKEIFKGKLNFGENKFFIEASNLESGFYSIKFESKNGVISKKFLVQWKELKTAINENFKIV